MTKKGLAGLKDDLDGAPARRMAGMTVGKSRPKPRPGMGDVKEAETRKEEELREAFWRRQERKQLLERHGKRMA